MSDSSTPKGPSSWRRLYISETEYRIVSRPAETIAAVRSNLGFESHGTATVIPTLTSMTTAPQRVRILPRIG